MAVHVVTDSTADLSPELMDAFGVRDALHIVPLTVHFGDEEFLDGVTITATQFYERLSTSEVLPRTSQPSPAAFVEAYSNISSPGDTILSFHISSRLSGTYQSALLAARQLPDRTIEVVDTRLASLGLGLVGLYAAKGVKEGKGAEEVLGQCRRIMQEARILFLVETLEYLQKNGRIGKAQALVGGLLNVKPLLTLEDGVVTPLEKARGKAKARARLLERVRALAPKDSPVVGAVVHAQAPDDAATVQEAIQDHFSAAQIYIAELGPVVGAHAGPGTLGVILFGQ